MYTFQFRPNQKAFLIILEGSPTLQEGKNFAVDYDKQVSSLPPGSYTLLVDARNLKGVSPQLTPLLDHLLKPKGKVLFKEKYIIVPGFVRLLLQMNTVGKELAAKGFVFISSMEEAFQRRF